MAGEVGHVVYGARMLTYLGNRIQHPSYWAGTLFPDIRHLGVVSRHRTHPDNVSLSDLMGPNDFRTGLRVHAWIDATREAFFRKAHIKERLPWHPFVPHSLKLLEDEMLYDRFDDWNLIQRTLNQIYDDELHFVPSVETIQRWHTILQQYFRYAPSDASRRQLSLDIGLSAQSADEINTVVHMLHTHGDTHRLLEAWIVHFEQLLK